MNGQRSRAKEGKEEKETMEDQRTRMSDRMDLGWVAGTTAREAYDRIRCSADGSPDDQESIE